MFPLDISRRLALIIGYVIVLSLFILSTYAEKTIDLRRVGVSAHWNRWSTNLSEYQKKVKPFSFVRDEAWWSGLQQSRNSFNWSYKFTERDLPCTQAQSYDSGYDNLVKLFQSPDAPELLLILSVKNDKIASIENISYEDYYQYVYNIVERYDKDGRNDMPGLIKPVRYFEVGNEVDVANSDRPPGVRHGWMDPETYVKRRLIPAYKAAKAANPNAIVMGAGLNMEYKADGSETRPRHFTTSYLEKLYDVLSRNGGVDNNFFMDKVAIHYYSQVENPDKIPENIKQVRNIINRFEKRDKPIWVTEYGVATDQFSEEEQAEILGKGITAMLNNGVEVVFIYELKDDPFAGGNFGLYKKTGCEGTQEKLDPKKAIQALGIKTEPRVPPPVQKLKDKTLIRAKNGIDVFWYQNSKRYHVLNPDILNKMAGMPGWGWNLVYEFDPSEIEKIPQGPKFIAPDNRSNGILVRQQGTNEVYKIENGKRQYVSFDECNRTNCWNNVIEVTSEIIGLFNQIPTPSRNFLVCAAGEDSLIDDLEIVQILDAWQRQKDYKDCGVPTDDDYMRALNLWQKKQPVDGSPPPGPNPPPATQKPIARFTMAASTGQSAKENEQLTLTVDKGKTAYILFNADNSYDPDGGSIRSYQWRINGTFVASTGRFAFDLGAGKHDIFLMVTDDEGQTGAVGATIILTEQGPICQADPKIKLLSNSRPQGIRFIGKGEYFSPDNQAILHLQNQYGQEILTQVFNTNSEGKFFIRIDNTNLQPGGYLVWFEDRCTGKRSNIESLTVEPASKSQAPQITSVDIPQKIIINTPTDWQLNFYDPEGDINWIKFEHYKNGQWVGIGEWDPKVYGQMRGTISIITTCDTLGIRTHRAILRDARGNESIPYEYSFECVAGYRQNPPVALLTISGYDSFSGYLSASNSETLNLTLNFASSTEINFSSNSYDPNGENLSYEWFINGQLVSTTDNFTQTLEAGNPLIEGAREYEVVLRVTNRSGLQAIAYARIIIAVVYVEALPGYIIKSSSSQTFIVTTMNKMIDLHIYDSGGRLVYHIAELPPRYQWWWNMRDQYGARVPNGVYLVVITVRDLSGYPIRREVRKIVVLR